MGSWVRRFTEGSASDRALLGGKGANLAEMTRLGLPVPPDLPSPPKPAASISTMTTRFQMDFGMK